MELDKADAMDRRGIVPQLRVAVKGGRLFDALGEVIRDWNLDIVAESLVDLNEADEVDVVAEFQQLKASADYDFFLSRSVFELALPRLVRCCTVEVMGCVQHLVDEVDGDWLAGNTFNSFVEFCVQQPTRIEEAITIVFGDPDRYSHFLDRVIRAMGRIELEDAVTRAIEFTEASHDGIRLSAYSAMAEIGYGDNSELALPVIDCLECRVSIEFEDRILGAIVSAIGHIRATTEIDAGRSISIMLKALDRGDANAVHWLVRYIEANADELDCEDLDLLLPRCGGISGEHHGTLTFLDSMLVKLASQDEVHTRIVELLEALLGEREEATPVEFGELKSFIGCLQSEQGRAVLRLLLTRWFMAGELEYCNCITTVASGISNAADWLEFDHDTADLNVPIVCVYLARKSVGFLFGKPVIAAKLLLSLIELDLGEEADRDIGSLLLDPLLLNYSGELGSYLRASIDEMPERSARVVREALEELDEYLRGLRSVDLPEVRPSVREVEWHMHIQNEQFQDGYKRAFEDAWIQKFCKRTTLLYGRRSTRMIDRGDDECRFDLDLQHYEHEMEIPRLSMVAPIGLELQLRVFRGERWVAQCD